MPPDNYRVGHLLSRGAIGLVVGLFLYRYGAGLWLLLVGPLTGLLASTTSFYLDAVKVTVDHFTIQIHGQLTLTAILLDGTSLAPLPAAWEKQAGHTMTILAVGLAVFAMPPVSSRHRAKVFSVFLLAAALACAIDLTLEIQHTALKGMMVDGVLGDIPFQDHPMNRLLDERLAERFRLVERIKAFLDAGGRLFFGVLAGWFPFFFTRTDENQKK